MTGGGRDHRAGMLPPGFRLCPVCQAEAYRGDDPACRTCRAAGRVGEVVDGDLASTRARGDGRRGSVVRGGRAAATPVDAPPSASGRARAMPPPPPAGWPEPTAPAAAAGASPSPGPSGGADGVVRMVVPGDPSPKERPRVATFEQADWDGSTRRVTRASTPKATKGYEAVVRDVAALHFARPFDGHVAVRVLMLTRRLGDVDNYVKAVLDGLQGVAYADDRQVRGVEAAVVSEFDGDARVEVAVVPFDRAEAVRRLRRPA